MKLSFALFNLMFLCPALAAAQVTVNHAALLQLAGIAIPAPAAEKPLPSHSQPKRIAHNHRVIYHHHTTVAAVKAKPAPMPVVARVAPPPPPPVVKQAAKPVSPSPAVLNFAAGSATLPANATLALQPFCASKTPVGINARAPGDASSTSAAMRLSLSRAMAVHDALVACGVPPADIIPRAMGDVPGQDENAAVVGGLQK